MEKESNSDIQQALYQLTTSIPPARRAWRQIAFIALRDDDISLSLAMTVLMTSRLSPNVQQKELAHAIGVNAAAMVRLIDQGEKKEVLQRTNISGDRRRNAINLLPKGEKLAASIEKKLIKMRMDILADIPLNDLKTATQVLRSLEQKSQDFIANSKADK